MLAPHAVDIAVIVSSLIASLCFSRTIRRHISPRQVKLCIGQRKYKQKFTTQRRKEGVTDRSTKQVKSLSLTYSRLVHLLIGLSARKPNNFHKIVPKRFKNFKLRLLNVLRGGRKHRKNLPFFVAHKLC